MDNWKAQKLAQLLLGLTDAHFNLIMNTHEFDLDVLLKQKYNVDVKTLGKLALALLPLVPPIQTSIHQCKVHVFIKKNDTNNNFYILAEMPYQY
ncbi:hypothetical protein [Photobacterium carnosum]|uniref:hypothetical protein n=1 Tax=Photobacterium carnosum TaxID=2023717 RepID=UPI001E42C348|nr:hypothetical protein [Photobacterium carnosum]MCD9538978.1 hypothetical protein [Photobacterium carnosum]MCF2163668.1 hypothetical protein [Photobacterium carnosum]MCF2307912.1 hypothetical protein [Photobacterium carnosum]